jgi:hypothetical protein
VVKGLNVNDQDYDKRTPLHLAAQAGHMEIVQYLVEHGTNINVKDRWGATPLNDTTRDDIKAYLIKNGGVMDKEMPQNPLPICSITDEQFRLFYAAHQNDILLIQRLNI